jgi:hypothetical protein
MVEDDSGTPSSLVESLRRSGALAILDEVAEVQVLIEFPFGAGWQSETGCSRFVRLRSPVEGFSYALVRDATDEPVEQRSGLE